jgi:hypothetical protein
VARFSYPKMAPRAGATSGIYVTLRGETFDASDDVMRSDNRQQVLIITGPWLDLRSLCGLPGAGSIRQTAGQRACRAT